MSFRQFLEYEKTEEFDPEELLADIHRHNSHMNNIGIIPEDAPIDPDDFYNKGGIFSFTYSTRKVKRGNEWQPEGLEISPPYVPHRRSIYWNQAHWEDHTPIMSGRYGVYEKDGQETPVLAIWVSRAGQGVVDRFLKPAVAQMWDKHLIHPETILSLDHLGLQGKVRDLFRPKVPNRKKAAAAQEVEIGGRTYRLYELPALLHSLPSGSATHQQISYFICNNHDKYPILKNFLVKAGCANKPDVERETEYQRRRRYWPTSEATQHDLWYHGTRKDLTDLGGHKQRFGGIHLGTRQSALDRLSIPSLRINGRPGPAKIYVFQVNLKKPYNSPQNPMSEHDLFVHLNTPDKHNEEWLKIRKKHDGLYYTNNVEDKGSISVLVFNKNSLRLVNVEEIERI